LSTITPISKYSPEIYEIQGLPYLLSEGAPIRFDKDRKLFRPEYHFKTPAIMKIQSEKGEEGMKLKALSLIPLLVLVLAFISSDGFAVPSGKTAEFKDGSTGKVVFSGTIHAEKGLKCMECHPKIFPMKKTTEELKMSDLNAGKYCGACHNGKRAFATNNPADCSKCHKK
jgi:c(7)-type cytochrome triheme protein